MGCDGIYEKHSNETISNFINERQDKPIETILTEFLDDNLAEDPQHG